MLSWLKPSSHSLGRKCGASSLSPLLSSPPPYSCLAECDDFQYQCIWFEASGQILTEWIWMKDGASEMSFPLQAEEVLHRGGARWMEDVRTAAWGSGRLQGPPINTSYFLSFISPLDARPTDCRHQLSWFWTINSSSKNLFNHFSSLHPFSLLIQTQLSLSAAAALIESWSTGVFSANTQSDPDFCLN